LCNKIIPNSPSIQWWSLHKEDSSCQRQQLPRELDNKQGAHVMITLFLFTLAVSTNFCFHSGTIPGVTAGTLRDCLVPCLALWLRLSCRSSRRPSDATRCVGVMGSLRFDEWLRSHTHNSRTWHMAHTRSCSQISDFHNTRQETHGTYDDEQRVRCE
jgi:hypothetical protein